MFTDAAGVVDRAQPSLGRHGCDHRDGHLRAGQQQHPPKEKAPIAETLKLNGYSTAQFGKCHEVPAWEVSPVGPFHAWPTGSGFEYFYGFIGGEANQYYPGLYEGTTAVEPPKSPEEGYTLNEDLANRAITWVRQQKALMPDKPFFIYYAPGATHAPHHVPKEWSDKYKGKFDDGWDVLREKTIARRRSSALFPTMRSSPQRHDEIPAWDDMPAELKPVLARQMEIYAGFLEQTDHEVGRVIDALEDLGILDDTLVYYILGDNGASAEGTPNGCFNEMATLNGMPGIETTEFLVSKIDDFGTPAAYNHYAVGWAHALCTPYQWTKQVASHWGGTRNGTIVHWPNGFTDKGTTRDQFHHVIDVAPTILRGRRTARAAVGERHRAGAAGRVSACCRRCTTPRRRRRTTCSTSRCSATAASTTRAGPRSPNTARRGRPTHHRHSTTTSGSSTVPTTGRRPTTSSTRIPQKLAELQRLWLIEAVKYNVVPLDDRSYRPHQPRYRGAPAAHPRQQPAAVLRHAGR